MTDQRHKAALIIAHNRQELLNDCIAAIQPQVDTLLVLDNASEPPLVVPAGVNLLQVPDQPPNIANLWNRGFDFFHALFGDEAWDVAMLCDDTVPPPGWFEAVTRGMRETGAAAGCSNPWGTEHEPRVKTAPDRDIGGRMVGWAFVLDGTKGIRADETMQWWWQDSSIDFEARLNGGMVMVGGYPVPNVKMGEYTNIIPGLGEQTGRDAAAFEARWGFRPW